MIDKNNINKVNKYMLIVDDAFRATVELEGKKIKGKIERIIEESKEKQ